MMALFLFENPASVFHDPAQHPVVVRRVLSRWLGGTNTADISDATGIREALCARIVGDYQNRRHERAARLQEGATA